MNQGRPKKKKKTTIHLPTVVKNLIRGFNLLPTITKTSWSRNTKSVKFMLFHAFPFFRGLTYGHSLAVFFLF